MAVSHAFHPEALFEYAEAAEHYLRDASPHVAERFATTVETAVATVVAAPTRWPVTEEPEIRRFVFTGFPFVLYYLWEEQQERVSIYAVMHCSREPGYWRHRIGRKG
jgi:toxin ParE1/3/4